MHPRLVRDAEHLDGDLAVTAGDRRQGERFDRHPVVGSEPSSCVGVAGCSGGRRCGARRRVPAPRRPGSPGTRRGTRGQVEQDRLDHLGLSGTDPVECERLLLVGERVDLRDEQFAQILPIALWFHAGRGRVDAEVEVKASSRSSPMLP